MGLEEGGGGREGGLYLKMIYFRSKTGIIIIS